MLGYSNWTFVLVFDRQGPFFPGSYSGASHQCGLGSNRRGYNISGLYLLLILVLAL